MEWHKNVEKEIVYQTLRSGGKGGQNVNKVETAVIVRWNVMQSLAFSAMEKERIKRQLAFRMTDAGELLVKSQQARTQLENKNIATFNILQLIQKGLFIAKPRIATKPTKSSNEKRLDRKKQQSERKANRRKW